MKDGIFTEKNGRFVVFYKGDKVGTARAGDRRGAERAYEKANGTFVPRKGRGTVSNSIPVVAIEDTTSKFHVNKRFEFLDKTIKMVAKGLQASAVISGAGGLGKSYSVKKALVNSGLKDLTARITEAEDGELVRRSNGFVVVKGFSTAKGLYRTLFENNDSIIVFDDCDSVLKDPIAQNLLKGALDSYDTRVINWNSDMRDEDLPRSFIFTGRVVFISNMPENKIDQAIRSRSCVIDVSMTLQEVVDRMNVMVEEDEFLPQFDKDIKKDAISFIDQFKSKMRDLSLRTLITVCKVRAADEDDSWKELAEYMTCK